MTDVAREGWKSNRPTRQIRNQTTEAGLQIEFIRNHKAFRKEARIKEILAERGEHPGRPFDWRQLVPKMLPQYLVVVVLRPGLAPSARLETCRPNCAGRKSGRCPFNRTP